MTVAIALVALVLGLALGLVIGHGTATSIDDQIAAGRDHGRDLVTGLRVLPLEYGQALAGSSESTLIEDTVKRATAQLSGALDSAPWLSPAQRRSASEAVQAVQAAARNKVPAGRFETIVARSTATLQSVFGLSASAGG